MIPKTNEEIFLKLVLLMKMNWRNIIESKIHIYFIEIKKL